jgi:hypothetical protein
VLLFLSLIFCKQEKNYCSLGAFQVAPDIKVQFQVIPETYRVVRYLTDESAHFEKKR